MTYMKNIAWSLLMMVPLSAIADIESREVYGVSLGMTIDEAEEVLSERMPDANVRGSAAQRVFETDHQRVRITSAHTEGFPVTRITRNVDFRASGQMIGDPIDLEATLEAFRDKYGEPDESRAGSMNNVTSYMHYYADYNGATPEQLNLNSSSFASLFSNGEINMEGADAVDTFLNIRVTEVSDAKGYVDSMVVELSDVATQRAFLYDMIDQQQRAQEEAADKLRESATTPEL